MAFELGVGEDFSQYQVNKQTDHSTNQLKVRGTNDQT